MEISCVYKRKPESVCHTNDILAPDIN